MSELFRRLHPAPAAEPEWVRRAKASKLPVKVEGAKK